MSKEILDAFGSLLMKKVRDQVISEWDEIIDGHARGRTAKGVQEITHLLDPKQIEAFHQLIPLIVDATLHYLLFALEQEKSVSIVSYGDEKVINDLKEFTDGLAGELYGQRGWIARFSKQRYEQY